HFFGSDRQIAFVLAVFIVANDDHATVANCLDGVLNGRERTAWFASALGDLDRLLVRRFQLWHRRSHFALNERPLRDSPGKRVLPALQHARRTSPPYRIRY